jgi:PAS domain S-box-containing protein
MVPVFMSVVIFGPSGCGAFPPLGGLTRLFGLAMQAALEVPLRIAGPDRLTGGAVGVFLLAMASVVMWLALRIGHGLPYRRVFPLMSAIFAASGAVQVARTISQEGNWPSWLLHAVQISMPMAMLVLSVFMFFSIPALLSVLRASDEARSLRGYAQFQALVQAAPMAVVGVDCQGRVTSWNPSAERIFGWRREEILGEFGKTVPPERIQEQSALLDRTLKGQIHVGFESERIDRNGERFPVSISTAPLYDERGTLTGMIATIEDIRARKSIERELHEKSATLATVTHALNTFLETGDWSAASRYLLADALQRTRSSFGFLGVILDGPVLRILAHDGVVWDFQTNRQLYEAKMSQLAANGYFELTHHENLLGEVIYKGKTVVSNQPASDPRSGGIPPGHPLMHSFLGVPIFKGTTVVGLIAVANRPGGYTGDELRSLETLSQATGVLYDNYRQSLKRSQLEEQRSHLESEFRQAQKMEVLGQLSGGIAHDFNNMLMVLSASSELLERQLAPHSAAAPYVEQIRRTVEKAAAVTRQLLAFSRKQVLDAKPVDLHEVLTDSEFMLPRLLGSDVHLTFQHQAAHSWILADPSQLEQVIANLAINARDAMSGGGSLTISTRNSVTLPEGISSNGDADGILNWVVLDVRDTGTGMDEETRNHLFEPFFTTKPLGKGTGLGLSTVYGTVRQFGGYICVESEPGLGTCFQLFFPARISPGLSTPSGPASPLAGGNSQGLTILLADDESSLRSAVAEYLRGSGHRVLEAHSPHDALELAANQVDTIDVLLTDIVMPEIRGTELAERVSRLHPGVQVIYMSGYAQGLPEAQVPHGASFLQKPFRFASLAEQLKLVPRKV